MLRLAMPGQTRVGATASGPSRSPFVIPQGSKISRFVVLSRLGSGSMGVVYSAYDPELDRKVALKLLRPGLASKPEESQAIARKRLLREAQALAKLSHPNVITIHDVGLHRKNVWLAMEYIDGETFRQWLKTPRTWREVVGTLIAAGRGLAAAHRANLMHRDFKPDNIMVDRDGRVRVMDLGLARASDELEPPVEVDPDLELNHSNDSDLLSAQVTRVGSLLGTPPYMSPEQLKSEPYDARADIFAFCVTLWEALFGKRPFSGSTYMALTTNVLKCKFDEPPARPRVPAWLRKICLKGFAAADDRWQSMTPVLEALERGLARDRWRRGFVVAGAGALACAAFAGYWQLKRVQALNACEVHAREIETTWNADVRGKLHASLIATGSPNAEATFSRLTPILDDHRTAWQTVRRDICEFETVEYTWDPELVQKATWCLEQRRIALDALIALLLDVDSDSIHKAVASASRVRRAGPCAEPFYLHTMPPAPTDRENIRPVVQQLFAANASRGAGRFNEAHERAEQALAAATELDWPPLTAQAYQTLGTALQQLGQYAESEAALEEAFILASTIDAHEIAASTGISLIETVGLRLARTQDGLRWWRLTQASIEHLQAQTKMIYQGFGLDLLAGLHYQQGEYEQARDTVEKSLELRRQALGEIHPSYASGLLNLAFVHLELGDHQQAVVLGKKALTLKQQVHGEHHPSVGHALAAVATLLSIEGDHEGAKQNLEDGLAIQRGAVAKNSPVLTDTLNNLGLAYHALGEEKQAIARIRESLAISREAFGEQHVRVAGSLEAWVAIEIDLKRYRRAKKRIQTVLEMREKLQKPNHPDVGGARIKLGTIYWHTGKYDRAEIEFKRALDIWSNSLGEEHVRLAEAWTGLARIALERQEFAQALELAQRAIARRQQARARPLQLAESQFLLARALAAHNPEHDLAKARTLAVDARRTFQRVGGEHAPLGQLNVFIKQLDDR